MGSWNILGYWVIPMRTSGPAFQNTSGRQTERLPKPESLERDDSVLRTRRLKTTATRKQRRDHGSIGDDKKNSKIGRQSHDDMSQPCYQR